MKIILENEKDQELLMAYNNIVFNSDERCANCEQLRHCVLNNDFEGFCARYVPISHGENLDIAILTEMKKDARKTFNICKHCIWCYVDDYEYAEI